MGHLGGGDAHEIIVSSPAGSGRGLVIVAEQPWYFGEVVYDECSALDAVHELSAAAASLQEALGVVEADVPVVVEEWAGRARMVFDEEMPVVLAVGHALVHQLLAAAVQVETTRMAAHDELQVRTSLRQAYDEEQAVADGEQIP
jgi:hypothetical protein